MVERFSDNPHYKRRESFDIAYFQKKEGLEAHDMNSVREAIESGAIRTDSGVTVEKRHNDNRDYLIVTLPPKEGRDEYKLFIKKNNELRNKDGGISELESGISAESILKDAGIEKVEVAKYLFAFNNHKTGENFVASKYNPCLETQLSDYLQHLEQQIGHDEDDSGSESILPLQAKQRELISRMARIKIALANTFYDVTEHNMAYDPQRDVIILFDLNNKISSSKFEAESDDEL
ncbi:MAG TPA: hypothetical protein VEC13_00585 [Candidatus Paceibacterota bacterium]|nr:hypothetical protein [Candidatus Paceibacterota bacterium]